MYTHIPSKLTLSWANDANIQFEAIKVFGMFDKGRARHFCTLLHCKTKGVNRMLSIGLRSLARTLVTSQLTFTFLNTANLGMNRHFESVTEVYFCFVDTKMPSTVISA